MRSTGRSYEEPIREGVVPPLMSLGTPSRTFISDLRPGRVATFEATVARLEPIREVEQRSGGTKKVRNGTLKDDSAEISFVLWGDEVELVAEGDRVRIVEGWVKDYKGRPQVSLGRTGKLQKV
jgi:replication factor A1